MNCETVRRASAGPAQFVLDRRRETGAPAALAHVSPERSVSIVYTPVHGVGAVTLRHPFARVLAAPPTR